MWCIKRYFHLFSKNIWYVMDQAPVSGLSLRRLIIEITHRMTLARLKSSPLVTFKVRVNRRRVHILSNQVHQSDDMCSRLVNFTDIRSPTRFFHPSYISFHGGQNWGRLKRYINAKLQPDVIFGELGSFFLRCMRGGVMEIGFKIDLSVETYIFPRPLIYVVPSKLFCSIYFFLFRNYVLNHLTDDPFLYLGCLSLIDKRYEGIRRNDMGGQKNDTHGQKGSIQHQVKQIYCDILSIRFIRTPIPP